MKEIILGILFATALIIYCIYKRRLNDFLLYKIDYLVVFITLITGFKILISNVIDRNDLILLFSISAFFFGFLQYRKNIEYEILNNYFQECNKLQEGGQTKELKNLILNLKILLPIVGQSRNIINIILSDISTLFGKKNENIEEILDIKNSFGGDGVEFTKILKSIKKLEERNLKKVKYPEGREKISEGIKEIEQFIKAIEDSNQKFFYKTSKYEKIINFLTP